MVNERVKTLATLLIGIVIGSVGIAGAAKTAGYWEEKGKTYSCYGDAIRVFCKETNWKPSYEVGVMPKQVAVTFQGSVIFSCKRGYRPGNNCLYFGP